MPVGANSSCGHGHGQEVKFSCGGSRKHAFTAACIAFNVHDVKKARRKGACSARTRTDQPCEREMVCGRKSKLEIIEESITLLNTENTAIRFLVDLAYFWSVSEYIYKYIDADEHCKHDERSTD